MKVANSFVISTLLLPYRVIQSLENEGTFLLSPIKEQFVNKSVNEMEIRVEKKFLRYFVPPSKFGTAVKKTF